MELPEEAIRGELAAELSRREFVGRSGVLGLSAAILAAAPIAARFALPASAAAQSPDLVDGTLQAFFDTIVPGKPVPDLRTELGNPIHPRAIAGVDREHGAVYTDALLLAQNPKLGFPALEAPFLAELEAMSLAHGGQFIDLDYEAREAVGIAGLDFANPLRLLWEAAAAIPFTAFCAAANIVNAVGRPGTPRSSAAYEVMGHPGTAPHGHDDFSYGVALSRERTKKGYLR